MEWIDTHSHLNDERFAPIMSDVLSRARVAGVSRMLVIGIDRETSQSAVELAEEFAPVYAVVGIQPNSLMEYTAGDFESIIELSRQRKVVGIGETGLDRYWDKVPIELQQEFFFKHLELASEADLPVVIHCREAEADVIAVLRAYSSRKAKPIVGVMHSFTGTVESARECLALGLHISFAGMVTFKKNDALRAVAAMVPDDRILVETDAPYLAPEPVRGKQNEPANVIHTGICLAKVRGVSAAGFARTTTENAVKLFRLGVCLD